MLTHNYKIQKGDEFLCQYSFLPQHISISRAKIWAEEISDHRRKNTRFLQESDLVLASEKIGVPEHSRDHGAKLTYKTFKNYSDHYIKILKIAKNKFAKNKFPFIISIIPLFF